jgi:hypothetical protein
MICTSSNWEDIRRYFSDTYVKFKEYGDRLFFIQHVDPSVISGYDEDEVRFDLYLSDSKPYTLDYILPSKATFQYKNQAYMLHRIPARQYRRGLCQDNTNIIRLHDGQKMPIDFDILKAFVNKPVYSTLGQALKATKGTHTISSRMWYNTANNQLFLDLKRVGIYDKANETLMLSPVLHEDVAKLMSSSNENIKVVSL